MKRILATFLATLVLAAGLPAAPAAAADVPQPGLACADINGDGGQSTYAVLSNREAVLSIAITTVAPLCRAATLTVYFTSDAAGTTIVGSATYPGNSGFTSCGPVCITYTHSYGRTDTGGSASAAPLHLYVYLQTSLGMHVVDRAPNASIGAHDFMLCDLDATTPDYDSNGRLILPCTPPGGNYFE